MKKFIIQAYKFFNALAFFVYIYSILNYSNILLKSSDGQTILFLIILGFINCVLVIKNSNSDDGKINYLLFGRR